MRRITGKIAVTFLIIILVAQVLSVLPAAGTANPPNVTWFKHYGGSNKDSARSIIQTSDGGYVAGGYTYSIGAGWADFWLCRMDSAGNKIWEKTYGGAQSEQAYSMVQTSDGGYALAGEAWQTTGPGGMISGEVLLVKTDANGNEQWSKTYRAGQEEWSWSVIQTSDGGYALTTNTNDIFDNIPYNAGLIKTDANGDEVWRKIYGFKKDGSLYSVVQTSDGGYALAGALGPDDYGDTDGWLIKTDANGDVVWSKTYGGAQEDYAYSMIKTSDGGYALAGMSWSSGASETLLVKTDANGNEQWSNTYTAKALSCAFSVIQTRDGGYSLAGTTTDADFSDYDLYWIKTDDLGEMTTSITFGEQSQLYEDAWSMVQTIDGGYALAGSTSLSLSSPIDALILKLEPERYMLETAVVPSQGGSVSRSPDDGGAGYVFSSTVTLTAVPEPGWAFAGWSGDLSGAANPAVLTVDGNPQVTATFVQYIPPPVGVTYGGPFNDNANDLVQTFDGGFALAGQTNSSGAGGRDMWLVKTDSAGNMLWDKTYGGPGRDYANGFVQTFDGGFALAGLTSPTEYGYADMWLVRTDSGGNMLWNKAYGGEFSDAASDLVQTADGGFALAGYTDYTTEDDGDLWLVRTDSAGNMLWDRRYERTNSDSLNCMVQTSDGGFALAGCTRSYGAGELDMWLIRLDSAGNELWSRTYGGLASESILSLLQTVDGGFALGGITYSLGAGFSDMWLVKTDSNGVESWSTTYGGPGYDSCRDLVQTGDGGFALAGYTTSSGAGGYDMWLVKADSGGDKLWDRTYGGAGLEWAMGLTQTVDNGFAVLGYTASFGYGRTGSYDAWLILQPPIYSLTISANPPAGGTVSRNPDDSGAGYLSGSTVALTAVPNPGYHFTGWSGDLTGKQNPAELKINEDLQVTAQFAPIPPGLHIQVDVSNLTAITQNWIYNITQDGNPAFRLDLSASPTGETFHLSGEPFASGGTFRINATRKFWYATNVRVENGVGTTSEVSFLKAVVHLQAGGGAWVTFTNTEEPSGTAPLEVPSPRKLTYQIPSNKVIPVQAAWNSDKNNDGKIDLVAGKPTAVLVNLTGVTGTAVSVDISFAGAAPLPQSMHKDVTAEALLANSIVSFYPILLDNAAATLARDVEIHCVLTTQDGGTELAPATVTVRKTNDALVSLYYNYLKKSAYNPPITETNYNALVGNSTAFINATYPVKNVTATTAYTQLNGANNMYADCENIADKALTNGRAVGVAVAPSGYFANYGNPNGAGISHGPNVPGVVVTEGFYTAAAHEVAHTFSVYWGMPEEYQYYPPYGQNASGVSAATGEWRSGYDFMGGAPYMRLDRTWVNSAITYNALFNKTTQTLNDPEIVVASGRLYKNGTFELPRNWSRLEGTPSLVEPGDYALSFVATNGTVLSETSFSVQFYGIVDLGVKDESDAPAAGGVRIESDYGAFVFAAVLPEGTSEIQILDRTSPEPVVKGTVEVSDIRRVGVSTEGYFTDADYNPIESFECVFTPNGGSGYKMSATNPGTFNYNLKITNYDQTQAFSISVAVPQDFVLKPLSPGANPVKINGQPAAYTFTDGTLTVLNVLVEQDQTKTLSVHLDYWLKAKYGSAQPYDSNSQTTFAKGYAFRATLNSLQAEAATVAAVGKRVTAIGGFLTDVNGVPKGGLTVEVASGSAVVGSGVASSDGFYFIAVPPGGPYMVRITNSLETPVGPVIVINVAKDQFVEKDFNTLSPADPVVTGFVTDVGGNGVAGVSVQLLNRQGKVLATTATNLGGYYVFRFSQPGQYTIKLTVPADYTATATSTTLNVKQFETAKVNFNLTAKP